jgi:hypothetical protein
LGHNPLSSTPCQNPGMVLNGQRPDHHLIGGQPYLDPNRMLNKQGLGHHILSDVLHPPSECSEKMRKGLHI